MLTEVEEENLISGKEASEETIIILFILFSHFISPRYKVIPSNIIS